MSKLPEALTRTGSSVAVRLPLKLGALAHRPESAKRKTGRTAAYGKPSEQTVTVPACDPKGPVAAQFTAAWADHMGADACTGPACFPPA